MSRSQEVEQYLLSEIQKFVRSGNCTPQTVRRAVSDMMEPGVDVDMAAVDAAIDAAFEAKTLEEAQWPEITDCDRLLAAFAALGEQGICALHSAGFEIADGYAAVAEAEYRSNDPYRGYCFYVAGDVSAALNWRRMYISFGSMEDDPAKNVLIGKQVREALRAQGFQVEWDETEGKRLLIPEICWQQRGARMA
jgi:hypothetical protein